MEIGRLNTSFILKLTHCSQSIKMKATFLGLKLKPVCLVIAILHLVSILVDLTYHIVILVYVTGGLQCEINMNSLDTIIQFRSEWWLLVLNLGTHGFYEYPQVMVIPFSSFSGSSNPKCYPGMIHVSSMQILTLGMNLLWLQAVCAYISALRKDNTKPMSTFYNLFILKLMTQLACLMNTPEFKNFSIIWSLKISDIVITVFFLYAVWKYIIVLKMENLKQKASVEDNPPTYKEFLKSRFNGLDSVVCDKIDNDIEKNQQITASKN